MQVAGLFAGVGGIELGLGAAAHKASLLCEIDPGARAVLNARFGYVPRWRRPVDVRRLARLPRTTEVLAAGFPCQDLSQVGTTAGIGGPSSGLVREVFRLLDASANGRRIPFVLLENVPFMLQLGRGRALDFIVTRLERRGYRWAYRVIDAMAFGLPQRRERVFLVACLDEDPRRILLAQDAGEPFALKPSPDLSLGFYWTEGTRGLGVAVNAMPTVKGGSAIGIPSAPAILLPSGEVVTPGIRDLERLQGFPADWTKPSEAKTRRSHRWKLIGNSVNVRVAKWLGQQLSHPGHYDASTDDRLTLGPWPRAAWNMGKGRFESTVSSWPVRRRRRRLQDFLVDSEPLSAKATRGFYARLTESGLKYPRWFGLRVRDHLKRMEKRQRDTLGGARAL